MRPPQPIFGTPIFNLNVSEGSMVSFTEVCWFSAREGDGANILNTLYYVVSWFDVKSQNDVVSYLLCQLFLRREPQISKLY